MQTWLIATAYAGGACAYQALLTCIGECLWHCFAQPRVARPTAQFARLIERLVLGQAYVATVVVLLGLAARLRPLPTAVLLIAPALAGLALWLRSRPSARIRTTLHHAARGLRHHCRAATSARVAILTCALIGALWSAQILIGGMAPDASQDSLWYHLTLPGQWLLRGDIAAFTHVMPSTYTLAAEALYVPLLMGGNEVLVTTFVAQVHLLFYLLVAAVALEYLPGWRGAVVGLAMALALATLFTLLPITAKNDIFCLLALLAGWRRLLQCWGRGSRDANPERLLVGLLFGQALAVKMVAVVPLAAVAGVLMLGVLTRPRSLRAAWSPAFTAAGGVLLVLAPWMLRGVLLIGHPLPQWNPHSPWIDEAFQPMLQAYANVPRRYPLSLEGLRAALGEDFARHLVLAWVGGDRLISLAPLLALVAFALHPARALHPPRALRRCAGAVLVAFGGFFLLKGDTEIVRYFAAAHVLAIPLVAGVLRSLHARSPGRWEWLVFALLLAGATQGYLVRQAEWGAMRTLNWRYRPVLTQSAQAAWMPSVENGPFFTIPNRLQTLLPADAVLLLPDIAYPYYFRRRAYWADPACTPLLTTWLEADSPEQALALLRQRGVSHVVVMDPAQLGPQLDALVQTGRIGLIRPPGDPIPWQVLEIVKNGATNTTPR